MGIKKYGFIFIPFLLSSARAEIVDIKNPHQFFTKPRSFVQIERSISDPVRKDIAWIHHPEDAKPSEIVLKTDRPLGGAAGTDLVIRIIQVYNQPDYQLGHFRVSLTTQTKYNPAAGDPRNIFVRPGWIVLHPKRVSVNVEGTVPEIRDDGSVFMGGKNANCTVTVFARSGMSNITGFRVEGLKGRASTGGFAVSKIEVEAFPAVSKSVVEAMAFSKKTFSFATVPLRRRTIEKKNDFAKSKWGVSETPYSFNPRQAAIVIIDMGNKVFCKEEEKRIERMVPRLDAFLDAGRKMGMTVVHSAAGTMPYYKEFAQRKRLLAIKPAALPVQPEKIPIRELPWMAIGRCDCVDGPCPLWKSSGGPVAVRSDIKMEIEDVIADPDNAIELYSLCRSRGIKTLFYCGSAANMCVQWRRGGMQVMAACGLKTILVRDAVISTSGNGFDEAAGAAAAWLTPERGDAIVIENFERFVGPTIATTDFIGLFREP